MANSAEKRELKRKEEKGAGVKNSFAWGRKQHLQMNHKWLK